MKNKHLICLAFTIAVSATLVSAQQSAEFDDIREIENYIERTVASTNDPAELYKAYYKTAEFYYHHGSQNIALDYFLAAAPYATSDRERARIYYAIGISSENINEASAGLDSNDYFLMAEELARSSADSAVVAHALFGRAGRYFGFLGVPENRNEQLASERRDSILTAVTLLLEAKSFDPEMEVLDYALSLSYAALKDFDKVQRYLDTSVKDTLSNQEANVRASLLISLGRYADAVTVLQRTYDRGKATGNEADMRNALHMLYYAWKYSGNTVRALDALESYSELRQKLMDDSFDRQVNIAQVRFDTILKEEKLAATEKENALYRSGLAIIGSALMVVVMLLGIVVFYYRETRKAHRALVQKSLQWADKPAYLPAADNGRDDADRRVLVERFDELMSREKLYLRPDLTLGEVAGALGINRTYLSDAINKIGGSSFTTLLNELRIRDAVKLISNPSSDQYTVDALAQMTGFANRKTFHNAFVRTTGLTPSEFRRNRGVVTDLDRA